VSDWRHVDPLSEAFVVASPPRPAFLDQPSISTAPPPSKAPVFFQTTTTTRSARQFGVLLSAPGEEPQQSAQLKPRRWRSASCSRGVAPKRSNTSSKAASAPRGRARKSWFPAARITHSQLLQLSGVGRGDLLKSHGIDIVLDAPGVGNDLQDHLQVRLIMRCAEAVTLNDIVNNPVRRIMVPSLQYAALRKGRTDDRRRYYSGAFFKTNPPAGPRPISRFTSCRSRPTRWARSCMRSPALRPRCASLRPDRPR